MNTEKLARFNNYNTYLKKYFGYDQLKDKQFEIIDNILHHKKDVCGILPTGYGKSICYQLPYLITQKTIFVVSPLISLMEDQMNAMKKLNIPVICLNSSVEFKSRLKADLLRGNHKIVYVTPEYLVTAKKFIQVLHKKHGIGLFAIDEAHCISIWGADKSFRPDYRKLKCIKKYLPEVPIVSLTATANVRVRQDICKSLKLDNPKMILGNLYRDNLNISIKKKNKINEDLIPLMAKYKDVSGSSIIYVKTRKDCDTIAKKIKSNGYLCDSYHAGLDSEVRTKIQKNFINNKIKIIVATIAFAMGIDKSDIRLVCHYGCPSDVSSYYQEIGRAGRDGGESECIMFYSTSDFRISRYFLKEIEDSLYRKYREKQIITIEKFVYSNVCRWKNVLSYFDKDDGDSFDICDKCDNCINKVKEVNMDFSEPAFILLKLVSKLDGRYGMTILLNILRGSRSKKMTSVMKKLPVYGKGIYYSMKWWKVFGRLLINEDYLCEKTIISGFGTVIKSTNKGLKWFNKIQKNCKYNYSSSPVNFTNIEINDADKLFLPVDSEFMIYQPKTPYIKTNSTGTSSRRSGGNQSNQAATVFDFANDFGFDLDEDEIPKITKTKSKSSKVNKINKSTNKAPIDSVSPTKMTSFKMFAEEGLTTTEIGKIRALQTQTIEEHVVAAISSGVKIDLKKVGLDKTRYNKIIKLKDLNKMKLSDIRSKVGREISYFAIKTAIGIMNNNLESNFFS
jgi:ATP-dependent DNA helicase RecQ